MSDRPDLKDIVPSTILQAVEILQACLSQDSVKFIQSGAPPQAVHFSAGMAARNDWSLWEQETPLKRDAVEHYGIAHADDLSGLIYAWLFAKVKGEDFDPLDYCMEHFVKHWCRYGLTPLEAGNYDNDGKPAGPYAGRQESCVVIRDITAGRVRYHKRFPGDQFGDLIGG